MQRSSTLSAYMPSVLAVFFAFVFISFPLLAAALLAGALLSFAVVYATVIYKMISLHRKVGESFQGPPSFRATTVQMFQRGGTWLSAPEDEEGR